MTHAETIELRIELDPWSEADVAHFLATSLVRVGGNPTIFSPAAMATISRFTGGQPRLVCRLAHLALAAAAGEGQACVGAATVERVWLTLTPAAGHADASDLRSDSAHQLPAGPPRSRVRPVRRLFE